MFKLVDTLLLSENSVPHKCIQRRKKKCILFVCLLYLEIHRIQYCLTADSVNIKILNAGAWSRSSEKVFVSLPTELEDLIPEVEEFYKKNHSGRKLHWHHLMSNGIVSV